MGEYRHIFLHVCRHDHVKMLQECAFHLSVVVVRAWLSLQHCGWSAGGGSAEQEPGGRRASRGSGSVWSSLGHFSHFPAHIQGHFVLPTAQRVLLVH